MAKTVRKRKHDSEDVLEPVSFSQAVNLDMGSDEEGEGSGSGSDDGQVDEFPEIDTRSDSEEEDFSGIEQGNESEDDDDDDDGEEEEEESTSSDSDSGLHIFPESKTIVSQITGQPKRVYPEIEPDYDSDSSTEDVRLLFIHPTTFS